MNQQLLTIIPFLLIIVVLYFLMIRPQKKKEKAIQDMRSSIQVGDDIITIGGFKGRVIKVKEDSFIVALGADKTKVEIMKWAISKKDGKDQATPAKSTASDDKEDTKGKMPKKLTSKKEASDDKEDGNKTETSDDVENDINASDE